MIKALTSSCKSISTSEEIVSVATISANGDAQVGALIGEAMAKVGREGTITVAEGKALQHALEVVEGLRFDRGYLSPYFITNAKEQKVELDAPYILIVDKRLSQVQQLVPALEFVLQNQAALLIVAEDVERYCAILSYRFVPLLCTVLLYRVALDTTLELAMIASHHKQISDGMHGIYLFAQ